MAFFMSNDKSTIPRLAGRLSPLPDICTLMLIADRERHPESEVGSLPEGELDHHGSI